MKTEIELTLKIQFDGEVADKDVPVIMQRCAVGVVNQINEAGISPDDSDATANSFVVSSTRTSHLERWAFFERSGWRPFKERFGKVVKA